MKHALLERARVIFVPYVACSAVLALFFGLICLYGGYGVVSFVLAWLLAHLGPLYPVVVNLFSHGVKVSLMGLLTAIAFSSLVGAGALAYLIHPAVWTRWISVLAIMLWFFCGFVSIIMGIT